MSQVMYNDTPEELILNKKELIKLSKKRPLNHESFNRILELSGVNPVPKECLNEVIPQFKERKIGGNINLANELKFDIIKNEINKLDKPIKIKDPSLQVIKNDLTIYSKKYKTIKQHISLAIRHFIDFLRKKFFSNSTPY